MPKQSSRNSSWGRYLLHNQNHLAQHKQWLLSSSDDNQSFGFCIDHLHHHFHSCPSLWSDVNIGRQCVGQSSLENRWKISLHQRAGSGLRSRPGDLWESNYGQEEKSEFRWTLLCTAWKICQHHYHPGWLLVLFLSVRCDNDDFDAIQLWYWIQ